MTPSTWRDAPARRRPAMPPLIATGRSGCARLSRDQVVVERRNVRLSLGLRPSSQALRACTMSAAAPAALTAADEAEQRLARLLLVDADPAFDGHRNGDRRDHRLDAVGDQRGLAHQAGAEPAALHPVRRAAAIEVDLVIAEIRADPRRLGSRAGSAPPSCNASGCSKGSKPSSRSRGPNTTASAVTISV